MVPEIEQDPKSEPQPEKKSRKDRIAEQKEKCERIVHYLQHGKHPEGLTKNQQRLIAKWLLNFRNVHTISLLNQ
jgi:hypothetical protein